VAAAQAAYDKGDFRWAAELLNHAVFGAPDNKAAKELLARTYEQMGYMSEAATWRNSYLTAAQELREWPAQEGHRPLGNLIDMLYQTPTERFLEAMAAGLNGGRCRGQRLQDQPGAERHPGAPMCCGSRTRYCISRSGPPAARRQRHPDPHPQPILVKMIAGVPPG
jgi:hypothetical protein